MFARGWFYWGLAWRDLIRLWGTTQHHVIIVAGICLPILMLLGLKRGHVETLRQDLITSPTGRQVTFWSARKGELMDRAAVQRLQAELPSIDLIIPESQRLVSLRSVGKGDLQEVEAVTLFATRPGDPLLLQVGIQSPAQGTSGIVLGDGLAARLSVAAGGTVEIVVSRGRGDLAERSRFESQVVAVMPTEQVDAAIGYVDLDILDQIDAYVRGFRVPSMGWASAKTPAPDSYAGYLVFCEASNDLTDGDRRFLADRGLAIVDRSENPPSPWDTLLTTDSRSRLRIYETHTQQSQSDPRSRLRVAPSELSQATEADDVVVPWNPPAEAVVEGAKWQMVGLSLPRRTWLREYLRQPDLPFDYDADVWQARRTNASGTTDAKQFEWPLNKEASLQLEVGALGDSARDKEPGVREDPVAPDGTDGDERESYVGSSPEERLLIVPANLLAWVGAYAAGLVEYDADVRLFVPRPQPAIYDRARLYAQTIDHVPRVVRALTDRQFAVMSETGRITEIHRQDESLQLLVWVVGAGVFLFGIVTVFSVLMDSTDRKRGTIGILRVMGMSRTGIFASVLIRAAAIGAGAALLSLACGWGLAAALGWSPVGGPTWLVWKPVITVRLNELDLLIVAAGAMLCCGLGAIPPAWKSSRLDPFDAIVEGRFR